MATKVKKGDIVIAKGGVGLLPAWFTPYRRYTALADELSYGGVEIDFDDEGDEGSLLPKGCFDRIYPREPVSGDIVKAVDFGTSGLDEWFTEGETYTVDSYDRYDNSVCIKSNDEGDEGFYLYSGYWEFLEPEHVQGVQDPGYTITMCGVKFDDGKLRYDLIPPEAIENLVKVLTFGAKKYGDRNWEKGMDYGRLFAATMRHLWSWWRGEDKDPETGFSHLAHALSCIAFLVTYVDRCLDGTSFDDRVKKEQII